MSGQREDISRNGMVSSAHRLASEAGVEVLKQGGNAVDAAVAAAFAIGVAEPFTSGIGGGGFMLLRLAGKPARTAFIDYREVAPGAAAPNMYRAGADTVVDLENQVGHKAVAVPGSVAGMALALELYGTLPLGAVVEPAAKLAERGIQVGPLLLKASQMNVDKLRKFPEAAGIYLKGGSPFELGDALVNRDYARTLRLIGREGPGAFYEGEIAEALVKDMKEHGGLITASDLTSYRARVREPLHGSYRGYEVISSPPPSSGGTHVIQILNMLEDFRVGALGHNSADYLHLLAEAFGRAFADRREFMGDPGFVDVPVSGLLSKAYARDRMRDFDPARASHPVHGHPRGFGHEGSSTTHLSVMDKWGNMVAVTQTVEEFFGCGAVLPGYGFILNDQMNDFDPVPGGANQIEPGKTPLSSMSPTLVFKGDLPFLTVGSPGSKRIITAVTQVLSNVIDHGMGIQAAIDAPRIHGEGGLLWVEGRIGEVVRQGLQERGHQLEVRRPYDFRLGGAHGVLMDPATGELRGGADPRRDGQAVGY